MQAISIEGRYGAFTLIDARIVSFCHIRCVIYAVIFAWLFIFVASICFVILAMYELFFFFEEKACYLRI